MNQPDEKQVGGQGASPIVHIGYHKTGSTWFQNAIYPYLDGFRYIERRLVVEAFLMNPAFHFEAGRARETLGLHAGESALTICEEELSGSPHTGGHGGFLSKEIARRLATALPDARIVVMIRRQPDIIASTYLQYVKGGGTHGPECYLFPQRCFPSNLVLPYKTPRFSFAHFEYLPLISEYQRLFGRDRVHVLLYKALRTDPEAFLADFGRRLSVDVRTAAFAAGKRYNESYGVPIVRLARGLNLFTRKRVTYKDCILHVPGLYRLRTRLLSRLNRIDLLGRPPSPVELLGAETVAWIEDRYRESNRRLVEICEIPLAAYGYPL